MIFFTDNYYEDLKLVNIEILKLIKTAFDAGWYSAKEEIIGLIDVSDNTMDQINSL